MRIGSLFSGIGGFDLAARWMGWSTEWYSEIDPYACKVMQKHFPEARNVGDVTEWRPDPADTVDLICGGFPCQPVSLAGKGLAQDDERWLWPEYARVLGVLRPRYVVVENVPGLRSRGMGDVLSDLATFGYDAEWESIPASAVGAPHQRDRVWIVAYSQLAQRRPHPAEGNHQDRDDTRRQKTSGGFEPCREALADPSWIQQGRQEQRAERERAGASRQSMAHANQINDDSRGYGAGTDSRQQCETPNIFGGQRGDMGDTDSAPENTHTAARRSWGAARESGWWESEPNVGRVAHGIPTRVDRLRCLGNAIVPQIAYYLFRQIALREAP